MSDPSGAPAGGQQPTGGQQPAPQPNQTPVNNQAPSGGSFNQEQVNLIVEDRLKRERASKEGWISPQDLEAAVKKASEETETRVKGAATFEVAQSEAKRIADKLRFHDSAEALRILDPEKLPLKDGKLDTEALEAAVKKLSEEKPYLVQTEDARSGAKKPGGRPKPPSGDKPAAGDDGKPRNAAEAMRMLGRSKGRG